jgi:hypothetical protein
MAEVTLDLTDDQIDSLLSEAESRLAAQDTAVTLDKNRTVGASNPTPVSARSELAISKARPSKEQSGSLELTVRKPELPRNKKKVRFASVVVVASLPRLRSSLLMKV